MNGGEKGYVTATFFSLDRSDAPDECNRTRRSFTL